MVYMELNILIKINVYTEKLKKKISIFVCTSVHPNDRTIYISIASFVTKWYKPFIPIAKFQSVDKCILITFVLGKSICLQQIDAFDSNVYESI